jgi:hypothetical protein
MRVDIFAMREGGTIDGPLLGPIRPQRPVLEPGGTYLLEVVVRTVGMGHHFTQGTADSNETWLDVTVRSGRRIVGRSGGRRAADGQVDPWSHFLNAFVVDRAGNRIDRRNGEDIFVALYDHQIPPGAADVVHYRLHVPGDADGPLEIDARLQYRKFDTTFMRYVQGEAFVTNDLPVTTVARDTVQLPVQGAPPPEPAEPSPIPAWERFNDYGIGLLRKGDTGELRGAEAAFSRVEALGRPDGPLNLARVYIKEGRVAADAPEALRRATAFDPPAPAWSVLWFTGLVNKQNGRLDEAIDNFRQIIEGGFAQAAGRGFDFSRDYRLLNELAGAIYLRAKQERGPARSRARRERLEAAAELYRQALVHDPENLAAHYGLKLVYTDLDETERAAWHAEQHARYKPDDNAADQAIAQARLNYPAANRAAEAVVIYDLTRAGTYELPPEASTGSRTAPRDE